MKRQYLRHQIDTLTPYLGQVNSILDFGCGDLSLSSSLIRENPKWQTTGIDVVDGREEGRMSKQIKFRLYDGKVIPFPANSFDIVIAYHVFHHCRNPEASFRECVRVARKRILVVEPIIRSYAEKPGFMLMDYLTNLWRKEAIPMPTKTYFREWWLNLFCLFKLKIICEKDAGILPKWLPIGKTVLYVLEKS